MASYPWFELWLLESLDGAQKSFVARWDEIFWKQHIRGIWNVNSVFRLLVLRKSTLRLLSGSTAESLRWSSQVERHPFVQSFGQSETVIQQDGRIGKTSKSLPACQRRRFTICLTLGNWVDTSEEATRRTTFLDESQEGLRNWSIW